MSDTPPDDVIKVRVVRPVDPTPAPGDDVTKVSVDRERLAATTASIAREIERQKGHGEPMPTAQALDRRLRAQARAVAHSMARFKEVFDEAMRGEIHIACGFALWIEYIANVVDTEMGTLSIDDRRAVVAVLEGMSTRAIGQALGVSHATVIRDQVAIAAERQVVHDVPPVTDLDSPAPAITGLDGKNYPRPKREPNKPDVPQPRPSGPVDPPAPVPAAEPPMTRPVGYKSTVDYKQLIKELRTAKAALTVALSAVPDGIRYAVWEPAPVLDAVNLCEEIYGLSLGIPKKLGLKR